MSKGPLTKKWEELEKKHQDLMGEFELMKFFSQDLRRKPNKKYMRQFRQTTNIYKDKTDEELLIIMKDYYLDLEEE